MIEFGKRALYLSLALLVGLILAQFMVTRHLPSPDEVTGISRAEMTSTPVLHSMPEGNITGNTIENEVSLSEIPTMLEQERLHKGKPVAIISADGLHFVNRKGYLVMPPKFPTKYDLPVISGDNITVDLSELMLIGESLHEALTIVNTAQEASVVLYNQISNISMHDSLGLLVQLQGPPRVNAVFGHGQIKQKVAYLATIMEKLEQSELLVQARYLDFRYRGQVVVKK